MQPQDMLPDMDADIANPQDMFNDELKQQPPQNHTNEDKSKDGMKNKLKSWFKNKVLKQGDVTQNYPNGDVYRGQMSKKQCHGKGIYNWKSGSMYDGDWLNNLKSGIGKQVWPDGSSYEGEWIQNQFGGKGTLTKKNGDVVVGLFGNGKAHGYCEYYYNSGDSKGTVYKGDFFDSKMHGQAEMMSNKGVWYLGQFVNSAKEGQGEMRFYEPHSSKGDLYKGTFKKNMRDGQGTYYFGKNELTYIGGWKNNLKYG